MDDRTANRRDSNIPDAVKKYKGQYAVESHYQPRPEAKRHQEEKKMIEKKENIKNKM